MHHYNHKADRSASFDLLSQVSDPSFMENMTEIATEIEQPREKRKSDKFQEFEDPMEQVLLSAQSSQSPTDLVSDGEIDSRLSKPWRIDPEIQTHVVNTFHLSEAILDELVMHMDSLNLSLGSLQVNSFLRLHWELAHKVQLRRPRKIKTTEDIQRLYYIARDFYKDANASEEIFR